MAWGRASRWAPAILAAGSLASLSLLAGCAQDASAGDRVAGDTSEQGYVSGDGTTTILAVADRSPAPALIGETLTGEQFDLADERGAVVVLNVWASWCAPCRDEAPELVKVSSELAERDVRFVGLNIRDSTAAAAAFVRKYGITYPNVSDPDGTLLLGFAGTLPPSAIPSTLVIDQKGRVAARAVGPVDRSRLLGLIEPVLGEQ
ncbi:MAG: TlpA family protein disulfide reductase [Candidatus Nanopelagicales bacterium]